MSIDDDILIRYALGHLSPESEAAVALHLRTQPEDAARVSGYLDALAGLALLLEPEPLPETGEAELLERVRKAVLPPEPVFVPPVVVLPEPRGPQIRISPLR